MKLGVALLHAVLYLVSLLPLFILHRLSEILYVLIYLVGGYRVKVVRENLQRSFPSASATELKKIERRFYLNFCDLIVETIKTFSISRASIRARCVCTTPQLLKDLYDQHLNLTGISSHLGNWEWLSLSLSFEFHHKTYGIYKPLSNAALDEMLIRSRGRFGFELVPMKRLREIFKNLGKEPIVIGLLSDQAPHSYEKAFEVQFLGQKTYVFPGPGIISVERNFTPVWGWMRRTGRSHFEWGVEVIEVPVGAESSLSAVDAEQVERMARLHTLSRDQAVRALLITQEFNRRLESRIRANPADWLWSHRRWKIR